jgi:hypothetical protein
MLCIGSWDPACVDMLMFCLQVAAAAPVTARQAESGDDESEGDMEARIDAMLDDFAAEGDDGMATTGGGGGAYGTAGDANTAKTVIQMRAELAAAKQSARANAVKQASASAKQKPKGKRGRQ